MLIMMRRTTCLMSLTLQKLSQTCCSSTPLGAKWTPCSGGSCRSADMLLKHACHICNPSSTFCQLHNIVTLMKRFRAQLLSVYECLKRAQEGCLDTLILGSRACVQMDAYTKTVYFAAGSAATTSAWELIGLVLCTGLCTECTRQPAVGGPLVGSWPIHDQLCHCLADTCPAADGTERAGKDGRAI